MQTHKLQLSQRDAEQTTASAAADLTRLAQFMYDGEMIAECELLQQVAEFITSDFQMSPELKARMTASLTSIQEHTDVEEPPIF